ncbi:MAG: corrinoid protein [Chloroflexota bacterium]|nr:corrinoid protein [Chloroflexota bacterium]
MADFGAIAQGVIDGDQKRVARLVQDALAQGAPPLKLLHDGLQAAMVEIGVRFKKGDCFVPEVLLAARAMHAGLDILRPGLAKTGVPNIGKVVIGTVAGDMHDIGKNLVGMMLEGVGFQVVDLGTNVSTRKFLIAVEEHQPDLVALSALITTTMPAMKDTVIALGESGLRPKVKVIVGGAPVTREYAKSIGADAYGADAGDAAEVCRQLLRR